MRTGSLRRLLRPTPPSRVSGIVVAASLIAAETLLVYPLTVLTHEPMKSIYLLGVLVVSTVWGLWLGVATAAVSALAYFFFFIPPTFTFTADLANWVELTIFFVVALLIASLADLSRTRAAEVEESDLTAEMARLLLNTDDVRSALPAVGRRLAQALELPSAAVELEAVAGDERRAAFPLRENAISLGTLLVPADLPERPMRRLQERVVPSLESLLHAAGERAAMLNSLHASREEISVLAREHAALRRVATLVARGVPASEVFDAVTTELAQLMGGAYHTWLVRYEPDGTATVVSTTQPGATADQMHWPIEDEDEGIAALVSRTGRAARMDSYEGATGRAAAIRRELGNRSSVGVPIIVEGRLWGVATVESMQPEPQPPDTEARIANFTDLAATAIANANSRDELIASRARIVAAGDEARRRIERDLHDGAQQQLIALALECRAAAAFTELDEIKGQLSRIATGLVETLDNLREISQGIHPAVLSTGGLGPALRALARRCAVPVNLDRCIGQRLPERVEAAVYYVVSESLTNTAKHAHASVVHIDIETEDGTLRLSVRDDGVGGADPARGSGLIGLRDRVEALGGQVEITSPAGGGTSLLVKIPIERGLPAGAHFAQLDVEPDPQATGDLRFHDLRLRTRPGSCPPVPINLVQKV